MGRFFPKSKILVIAVVLVFANVAGVIRFTGVAYAFPQGAQLTNRSIIMSDSTPDGSGVSYQVNFKPGSATYTVKGIIVDFCSNSPTVGSSTCTAPGGFTVGTTPTVTTTGATGGTVTNLGGTWTAASLNSGRTLKLTNSTGVSINPANSNPYAFTITGVHNPTANGTFYARIITYLSDTTDIGSYAPGNEGNSSNTKDYGGVALSTASVITITARVPEQLSFCISSGAISANCTGLSSPDLTLGHVAGTPGAVVDTTAVDTVSAYTQVSTNAQNGVSIRMRNLNTCTTGAGGLQRTGSTVCDIPAVNSGGATAAAITQGTAAFGMLISSVGSGFTAQAPYVGPTNYGMDATTTNQNVTSTYGDVILTSSDVSASVNNTLQFGATASATTPAGVYSAKIILICTGQF